MRTMKELADEAYFIQNACNLIALVKGFDRALTDLREHGILGDALNCHPITRLWIDKLCSLSGLQLESDRDRNLSDAYDWVFSNGVKPQSWPTE